MIDQHSPKSEAWRPALPVAEFDQPALSFEDLRGKLTAVFARHRAFDALDDGGGRTAVVFELFSAIMDFDAGALAKVFVVRALIGILEPAPAANVVNEDGRIISQSCLHVVDHLAQGFATSDVEPA